MRYKILFSILLFFCSCEFYGRSAFIIFDDLPEETLVEKSLNDEEVQEISKIKCEQEAETCSEYESCKVFCDDLFYNHQGRKNCYEWSYSFFKDFKKVARQLETLSFTDLEVPAMKCFFEMSSDHRINFFKNFTDKSAEIFLTQITINKELAWSVFKADKENFNIFEDLFEKIDKKVQRAIREEIFLQNHFLILAQKHNNKSAWSWVDSFIRYDCKKTSACQHPLEYYCDILKETPRKDLEFFLENSWFERAYKSDIELEVCDSYHCEYGKISDFKEFCKKN